MGVSKGKLISLEYTLTDEDKHQIDSNVGEEPLVYLHGEGQIVPGLEKELEGMNIGESKGVTVEPEGAYGAVNEEAFVEVPRQQIPAEAQEVGAQLQVKTPDGQVMMARVADLHDGTAVLDFNHPLAGRTLHFDIKILDVQDSEATS